MSNKIQVSLLLCLLQVNAYHFFQKFILCKHTAVLAAEQLPTNIPDKAGLLLITVVDGCKLYKFNHVSL